MYQLVRFLCFTIAAIMYIPGCLGRKEEFSIKAFATKTDTTSYSTIDFYINWGVCSNRDGGGTYYAKENSKDAWISLVDETFEKNTPDNWYGGFRIRSVEKRTGSKNWKLADDVILPKRNQQCRWIHKGNGNTIKFAVGRWDAARRQRRKLLNREEWETLEWCGFKGELSLKGTRGKTDPWDYDDQWRRARRLGSSDQGAVEVFLSPLNVADACKLPAISSNITSTLN